MGRHWRSQTIQLRDGRRLAYLVAGQTDGRPVVALHGTPGSKLKFAILNETAARLGLALYCLDRWGYGGTDCPEEPTFEKYGLDVREFMTAIGHDRFDVVGISGGGPFAVAVAAYAPQNVTRLALIAPVGNVASLGPSCDGFGLFHRFCFRWLSHLPGAANLAFAVFRFLVHRAPSLALSAVFGRAGPSDRKLAARPEVRRHLIDMFRDGLSGGVRGPVLDMTMFARPWPKAMNSIVAPTAIWSGGEDQNVPPAGITRLANSIPTATTYHADKRGHFWISAGAEDVLTWLATEASCLPAAGGSHSDDVETKGECATRQSRDDSPIASAAGRCI